MSLTRADLRSRVGGAIGLSTAAGSSELALIDGWLDEAVEQFLINTKCSVDTSQMNLTADEGDYTVPTSVLAFKRLWIVTADGTNVTLEQVSTDEIIDRRRYQTAGSWPSVFALEGYDFLRIDPAAASSSDVLHMDYIPAPTSWNSGTPASDTPPFVPSWGHPALEEYAKWKAADWDDDTSSQIGMMYQKNWEQMLKDARRQLNKLAGGWAPARVGGRTRRRTVPTSPGVDTGN
jgi:hypothetical protein